PLARSTGPVVDALNALATGDSDRARAALGKAIDSQDARVAYDVAWCWHFLGDEGAAYTMALRAYLGWPDAATKPLVLSDVLRLAAWAEIKHDEVIRGLGGTVDNKTRLALAEAYDARGRFPLVIPTIESMTITDDWVTRVNGLYLMARRAYM